jgi:hypothetical protein
MERDLVIHGVLVPAALALAVIVASRSLRTRTVGLALALAFIASAARMEPLALLPSEGSWTWLTIGVGACALIGAAAGERGAGRAGRAATCVLAALLAALLAPLPEWRDDEARLVLAGAVALHGALLLPIGMHRGGFSVWLSFSLALAGTSVVALVTGFAKLAIPCGAVSFTCGCIGLLATLQPERRSIHAGIGGALALAACSTMGAAGAFAFETGGVPKLAFVLAATAPLGCWLGEAPPFRASRAASALARVTGVVALAAAAVWMAASHRPVTSDAYALAGEPHVHERQESRAR